MKGMSKLVLAILLMASMLLVGCATSKELSQASQSYSQALNDPMVARNGAAALEDAHTALEQAQRANTWEDQQHYAYVAQRNVDLARIQAAEAQSKMEMAQLQGRSDMLSATLDQQKAAAELRGYRSQNEATLSQISEPHFGFDKAQLPNEIIPELRNVSEFLQQNTNHRVLVEGFTDSIGTPEYNHQLGLRRAQAVAKALEADGIPSDRIITRSMGEKAPVANNNTASGRQQNRRAVITILNSNQNPEDVGKKGGGM